jgi:hypothetical protein
MTAAVEHDVAAESKTILGARPEIRGKPVVFHHPVSAVAGATTAALACQRLRRVREDAREGAREKPRPATAGV